MSFELSSMWASMGALPRLVVIIILFMSVYAIAIGVERLIVFNKAKKQSQILLRLMSKLWQEGKIDESIKLCSDKKFKNSHLAKVLVAGLNEMQYQADSKAPFNEQVEAAKRAVERATIKGILEFKRGINALATIGSTGPFVGLFGTVFGIITAFQGIAISGSGGLGSTAQGIAEALITTGAGIGVAVIAVWFFNFLLNKIDVFTGEMANASSELIDHFIKLKQK